MDTIINMGSFGDESFFNTDMMPFGGIMEVVVTLLKEYVSVQLLSPESRWAGLILTEQQALAKIQSNPYETLIN
jgi:hypothetical protein